MSVVKPSFPAFSAACAARSVVCLQTYPLVHIHMPFSKVPSHRPVQFLRLRFCEVTRRHKRKHVHVERGEKGERQIDGQLEEEKEEGRDIEKGREIEEERNREKDRGRDRETEKASKPWHANQASFATHCFCMVLKSRHDVTRRQSRSSERLGGDFTPEMNQKNKNKKN